MDRLPSSEALRPLPVTELIRFLFLIVNELNRRINQETEQFEVISDTSDIPPPPPAAASSSHRRPREPRGYCGQVCRFCALPCSRSTANHGHHSCYSHRYFR